MTAAAWAPYEISRPHLPVPIDEAALEQPREKLMYALGLLQVAISVASVTVLTRQRWLFAIALLGSLAGLGVAAAAFFA